MSNSRSQIGLVVGFVIGLFGALTPACGPAKLPCNASTCNGCCDAAGLCQLTGSPAACGAFGQKCMACAGGQVCNLGVCTLLTGTGGSNGGNGGGTGGSGFGGGTGGAGFGGGTGGSGFGGGTGGSGFGGGAGGGTSLCTGCLAAGQCIDISSSNRDAFCGAGGVTCADCRLSGATCNNFQCAGGTGGGTGGSGLGGGTGGSGFGGGTGGSGAGSIGAPCSSAANCAAVPLSAGFQAICKQMTIGGNATYSGGYCTRRCLAHSDCGSGGLCHAALGPYGEWENICLKRCSGQGSCGRTGYECYDFGASGSPAEACWLSPLPAQVNPGPGSSGAAGAACVSNSDCGTSGSFACITANPGGQCSANCSVSLDDAWCGTSGLCAPFTISEAVGPRITWACFQGCNPTGANTCRSSYVCAALGGGPEGACFPDCRVAPATCNGTCNASTGICQ